MTCQITLVAAPLAAENSVKLMIAAYRTGFRPMMSVRRPFTGVMTVCASK